MGHPPHTLEETSGNLHLSPSDLEQARMDSAKFHHPSTPEAPPFPDLRNFEGPLRLAPRELEQARMSMATFRSHERMRRQQAPRRP